MAYNRQNYIRLSEEFRSKYRLSEARADERRAEIHVTIPQIAEIDSRLAALSSEIMSAVMAAPDKKNTEEAIIKIRQTNDRMNLERRRLLRENGYPEDYTDPHYECDICADTGFVGTAVCSCLKNALILAGYESAGIATLIGKCSFERFSLEYYRSSAECYQRMKQIFEASRSYAEHFSLKSGNLLMVGGTGLGKTHLSVSIAKTVIERGFDAVYASATGMLADFEFQRFGSSGAAAGTAVDTSKYFNCELLIIDDLGTEITNQFTTNCIYNLINVRLNNSRPTLISTNLMPADLRTRYWDRITSRIFGEYKIMAFLGKDVRMQKISSDSSN